MIKLFRYPLILFLVGILLTLIGSWAKILHLSFSDILLTAGMILQAIGLIYSIYILIKTK
jgi:hypothetical protein